MQVTVVHFLRFSVWPPILYLSCSLKAPQQSLSKINWRCVEETVSCYVLAVVHGCSSLSTNLPTRRRSLSRRLQILAPKISLPVSGEQRRRRSRSHFVLAPLPLPAGNFANSSRDAEDASSLSLSPFALLTTNAFRTRFAGTKEPAICLYYETAGFARRSPLIFMVLGVWI